MVEVCLLGCGGMMPLPHRRLAALLIRYKGRMILIDCGEGTQLSVRQAGWGFKAIDAVLFTHCHADHIAGLPGFLLTLGNAGRTEPLKLVGPKGLADVVRGLCVIAPNLPFDVQALELSEETSIQIGGVIVENLPMTHTVPCFAYSLYVPRSGRFDAERARLLGIPVSLWHRLQHGETITHAGKTYRPESVLGPQRRGIKITYCTDARPSRKLMLFCGGSDLLVCEGLYGENEKLSDAIEKKHMIFSEAAQVAKESGSRELWLTHYSPSLKVPEEYIHEAASVFPNSFCGYDLKTAAFRFSE